MTFFHQNSVMGRAFMCVSLVFALLPLSVRAQKGIVWDAVNHRPVIHANLYTSGKGLVRAVSTDSLGHFSVTFPFHTLTVSHVSYQRRQLSSLPDTIFLTPHEEQLGEVVVNNQEPAWIREKLLYFVKNRKRLYQAADSQMEYQYETSNLGDSVGYGFRSAGLMYVPSLEHLDKDSVYQVCPDSNIVYYKDSTARVDFSGMTSMLYDNFVTRMDRHFVRHHRFCENKQYDGAGHGWVQFSFWSDRFKGDHGSVTMDTARCVIIEAHRSTGLQCNLREKVGAFVLGMFRMFVGMNFTEWSVDQRVRYELHEGLYCPAAISYKYYQAYDRYDRLASSKKKQRKFIFESSESRMTLRPTGRPRCAAHYYDISRYPEAAIIFVETKRVALNREAMRQMPHESRQLEEF
ncbi:MAG: carboxypeptidase-like regulatory domain-containing protein [Prevotella sp.]|nr:carboxypeptidase-like regulatory domain-containing protein [Prevotella sp.]